jgi:hypothetical protein
MRVVALLEWASLGVLMGGIATIGRIGVLWTCGVVGVVFTLRTLALMWAVTVSDGVPLRRFLLPLLRPFVVCVAMVVAIVVARPALHGLPAVARLFVEIGIGAAVYLAGAVLVFRDATRDFLGLIRSSMSGR